MSEAQLDWQSCRSDFEKATTDEIVQQYDAASSVSKQSNVTRKVSDTVVVKRISFDGEREYANLKLAWEVFNGNELRVPEPIRYFEQIDSTDFNWQYIVMEYLQGTCLEGIADESHAEALAKVLLYMRAQTRGFSTRDLLFGPPTGGLAEGFPWGLTGAEMEFRTIRDLVECAHKRLKRHARNFRLTPSDWDLSLRRRDCTLCHMDLAPRNILLLESGGLGIVDWATLAYYPFLFELAFLTHLCQLTPTEQRPFFECLLSTLQRSTGISEDEIFKIRIVHLQSMSFHYG